LLLKRNYLRNISSNFLFIIIRYLLSMYSLWNKRKFQWYFLWKR